MMDAYHDLAQSNTSSAQLRRWTFGITFAALLCGAASMIIDLRLGLLAAAFILGWTQLVGL